MRPNLCTRILLPSLAALTLSGHSFIASAADNAFAMEQAPSIPGYEPSTDPRDFSGLWRSKPVKGVMLPFWLGVPLPLTTTAQARVDYASKMSTQGTQLATPHVMCRPTGANQAFGPIAPVYVLQNSAKIAFVVMDEIRDLREVYFADAHPTDITPSYGGDSIAHWQGDTLMIDTIGFNGRGMLDTARHSDQLHLTESISKSADGTTLFLEITLEDPETFTAPVTIKREWAWVNGQQPLEFDCEENPREDNFSGMVFEDDYLRPICIQHEGEGEDLSYVVCENP
ncbi:MAG: hypothetical protein H6978_10530 [Gammaproteobacteria bacterium]|nr:hypothetical protein [Gammaproteobacteria bacterium]